MKKIVLVLAIIVLIWVVWKFFVSPKPAVAPSKVLPTSAIINKPSQSMKLTSIAFENNQSIPTKYTCDGDNINPELSFVGIPESAKSLTLIMDDPDAPRGTFDHWIVFNIPTNTPGINEGSPGLPGLPGLNSAGQTKYTGPCPPDREHRYFFKLYALDTMLDFPTEKPDKKMIEDKMKGHILEQAELIGLYNRK